MSLRARRWWGEVARRYLEKIPTQNTVKSHKTEGRYFGRGGNAPHLPPGGGFPSPPAQPGPSNAMTACAKPFFIIICIRRLASSRSFFVSWACGRRRWRRFFNDAKFFCSRFQCFRFRSVLVNIHTRKKKWLCHSNKYLWHNRSLFLSRLQPHRLK